MAVGALSITPPTPQFERVVRHPGPRRAAREHRRKPRLCGRRRWRGVLFWHASFGANSSSRAKGAFKVMAKTGVLRGNVCTPTEQKPTADENYLRADLVKQLANEQVCIDIFLQFQENADSEPIEDVSVERKTPFVKAGRVVFAKQQLEDTDQGRCDSFSFQPWHTLQVHKPLGNVMRARRIALPASASYRGAYLTEPTE
jgi:hypothetical protein